MPKPPAFQFYARDWLSGKRCRMLRPAERAAYIDLMAVQWMDGTIPTDEERLADLLRGLGNDPDNLRIDRLLDLFPEGKNDRLEEEREKQEAYRNKKAAAGRKGAAKRWSSDSTANSTAIGSATDSPIANDSPAVCSLQSSSSKEAVPREARASEVEITIDDLVTSKLSTCAPAVRDLLQQLDPKWHKGLVRTLICATEGLPPIKGTNGKTVLGEELQDMISVTINRVGPELPMASRPTDKLMFNLNTTAQKWDERRGDDRPWSNGKNGNGRKISLTEEELNALPG